MWSWGIWIQIVKKDLELTKHKHILTNFELNSLYKIIYGLSCITSEHLLQRLMLVFWRHYLILKKNNDLNGSLYSDRDIFYLRVVCFLFHIFCLVCQFNVSLNQIWEEMSFRICCSVTYWQVCYIGFIKCLSVYMYKNQLLLKEL